MKRELAQWVRKLNLGKAETQHNNKHNAPMVQKM